MIPWAVAGRIGLLFAVLCVIKLVMLLGFHHHLVQIHWGILKVDLFQNRGNSVAFYLFALLIVLNLWQFGNRCAAGGLTVVRTANLCVLGLGVSFILLTFRTGTKNYLISLFAGAQTWGHLFSAFISEPPVWALWLTIYCLFYYVLVRLGREHQVLRVTAVLAAVYTLLFIQDIKGLRNSLVVADCLGTACLLVGAGSRKSLRWFWLIQPWVWLASFMFFFLFYELTTLRVELYVFSSLSIVLIAGASAFAWRGKYYWAWSWLLPFVSVAFLIFSNLNYSLWFNYQNLFCLGLTLPHYFLGEFAIALVLLVVATVYRWWLPSESLLWLDGINLLLITLALADLRLTQIMGVRLDWQAIKFGADATMVWRQAQPYLPDTAFGLVLIVSVYAILVGLWRRADAPQKSLPLGRGACFLLMAFILLGLAGNWFARHDKVEGQSAILLVETSPWLTWFSQMGNPIMDEEIFVEKARQLGMGQMLEPSAAAPTRPPRDLNVVLISLESSPNQHLSLFGGQENTQPLFSKYRERMELFPNIFSSFAISVNARFAMLTGLYPVRDYEALTFHRVEVNSIFEILHDRGYVASVFDSASLDYSGFREFLRGRGLDAIFDANTMPGRSEESLVAWGVREDATLKAIQSQIQQYAARRQKFFLTYFPVAPHHPFDGIPSQFCKFSVVKASADMPWYKAKYLDELLYLDWVVTAILDELKNSGLLDHTLVIITDDHGEMLGENGGPIGHGWVVRPELANIPLIIMDPDHPGYRLNNTVGSQVDVLPTILDLLGIPLPSDQLYQGASLYSSFAKGDRKIYLNSFQQYAIIEGHRFLCGDRESEISAAARNSPFQAFSIANEGARTIFSEIQSTNLTLPSISPFDQFQENLLENYEHYSRAVHSSPPVAK